MILKFLFVLQLFIESVVQAAILQHIVKSKHFLFTNNTLGSKDTWPQLNIAKFPIFMYTIQ